MRTGVRLPSATPAADAVHRARRPPRHVPPPPLRLHRRCSGVSGLAASSRPGAQATLVVGRGEAFESVTAAVAAARPGDRVRAGRPPYHEPTIVIRVPLTSKGRPEPSSTEAARTPCSWYSRTTSPSAASSCGTRAPARSRTAPASASGTRGTAASSTTGWSSVLRIFLEKVAHCLVADNVVQGEPGPPGRWETPSRPGRATASSRPATTSGGIATGSTSSSCMPRTVHGNTSSSRTQRYGMHFMFSDDCRYDRQPFIANGNGVAVMYSHRVQHHGQPFERNWGSAAYGLLLKEISDGQCAATASSRTRSPSTRGCESQRHPGEPFRERLGGPPPGERAGQHVHGQHVRANPSTSPPTAAQLQYLRPNFWDRYRGYDLDRDHRRRPSLRRSGCSR